MAVRRAWVAALGIGAGSAAIPVRELLRPLAFKETSVLD